MKNMEKCIRRIESDIDGRIIVRPDKLKRYARDRSIFEIPPGCCVIPVSENDICCIMKAAQKFSIPVTVRGGGSGTAGAAIGSGIIIDLSQTSPLNRIISFAVTSSGAMITVQPGVIHNELQQYALNNGCYLPADPSSGAISTIGGNISTRASGPHALKHGSIDQFVEHVRLVTSGGDIIDTRTPEFGGSPIYLELREIQAELLADKEVKSLLMSRIHLKSASGINLSPFVQDCSPGQFFSRIICGSVGTLGVITEAVIRLAPAVEGKSATLLWFHRMDEAARIVAKIKDTGVAAIEIMNAVCVDIIRKKGNLNLPEPPVHALMVEYTGPERFEQIDQVDQILKREKADMAAAPLTVTGAVNECLKYDHYDQL